MSHFTTVKTKITEKEILKKTLLDLGYKIGENDIVRGYSGIKTIADIVIKKDNKYDIGFKYNGNTYDLVADFYGTDEKEDQFVNKVTQRYSVNLVLEESNNNGFNVSQQEVMSDGTIKVVVNRWV